MKSELLTTGQAAKLCSVTPDTVLKWIRAGRLPARRTAGGHHRILLSDLEQAIDGGVQRVEEEPDNLEASQFTYCWDYNGEGELLEGCADCVVYKMRAQRCYEVVEYAKEIGHNKVFCKGTCLECDYYKIVHRQASNVLTITDNDILAAYLRKHIGEAPFNLEFAECEYTTSALVDKFRPDYVIIDCSLGATKVRDVVNHLKEDPRIPHIRVVLAVEPGELPHECDKEIFARIEKPFTADDIVSCVSAAGVSLD
jgi:excisionase family DNA binding protein